MMGQRFDQYRVIERIGDGGMGTVYRAVDETLGREVAVKLLRPELANRPDVAERFHLEAITLGKLNHANIATLYGLSRRGTDCFMVMEYVRGETLEQVLRRVGRLPWDVVVRIGRQVLAALAYAHGMQVVHRAIKPSNLMLDAEGRIKVMDFGLARALGGNRSTGAGHIVGTLEYMAPEQIRGHEVDGRTDQYALAMVLYELLTGAIPFKATSDYALMTAHLEEAVAPLRQSLPDVPEWLDRAIGLGLSKLPEARHANAQSFRVALATGATDSDPSRPLGGPSRQRIVVDDPTDPVALGLAETIARIPTTTSPPARIARADAAGSPAVPATRLAEAPRIGESALHDVENTGAAGTLQHRATLLFGGIGVVLVTLGLWIGLRPSQPAQAPSAATTPRTPAPASMPRAQAASSASPIPATVPVAGKIPLPARASSPAPRTFDKVNMITWDEDEPEEKAVRLTLQADRLVLRDAQSNRVMRSIAYADIDSALYWSKELQLESGVGTSIGKMFTTPVHLFPGQRHWLTVKTGDESLFIRLDKQRVDEVLPAFEQLTGVTVAKGGR